jgi:hypothetical protein
MAGRPSPSAVHSELVGDGAAAEAFAATEAFDLLPGTPLARDSCRAERLIARGTGAGAAGLASRARLLTTHSPRGVQGRLGSWFRLGPPATSIRGRRGSDSTLTGQIDCQQSDPVDSYSSSAAVSRWTVPERSHHGCRAAGGSRPSFGSGGGENRTREGLSHVSTWLHGVGNSPAPAGM